MTRETKVGLLVGMGVILLVGIILSDQFALMEQDQAPGPGRFADEAQDGIGGDGATARRGRGTDGRQARQDRQDSSGEGRHDQAARRPAPEPMPTREEIQREQQPPQRQRGSQERRVAEHDLPPRAIELGPQQQQQQQGDQRADVDHVIELPGDDTGEDTTTVTPPEQEQRQAPRQPREVDSQTARGNGDIDGVTGADYPHPEYHTVQSGETLYDIAKKYFDDGKRWRLIRDANEQNVTEDGDVRAGVTLAIPVHSVEQDNDRTDEIRELQRQAAEAWDGNDNNNGNDNNEGGEQTAPPPSPRTIQVQRGDTLAALAAEHLGSSRQWRELYEANRDKLDNPDVVPPGVVLQLPESAASEQADTQRDAPARASDSYLVQQGDNLSDIAEQELGDATRWRELYEANRDKLDNPDVVPPGVVLHIPS